MTGLASALAGAECILAFGLLDGAQAVSLAKTVLDCDTVGAIRRFVRDDPIDASTALFDDIRDVGIGGHYLGAQAARGSSCTRASCGARRSGSGRPFESLRRAFAGRRRGRPGARDHRHPTPATPVDDDVLVEVEAGDRLVPGDRGLRRAV